MTGKNCNWHELIISGTLVSFAIFSHRANAVHYSVRTEKCIQLIILL